MMLARIRSSPSSFTDWLGEAQARRVEEALAAMVGEGGKIAAEPAPPERTGAMLIGSPKMTPPLAFQIAQRDRLHAAFLAAGGGVRPSVASPVVQALERQISAFLGVPPRVEPPRESPIGWLLPYMLDAPYRAAPERAADLKGIVRDRNLTFEIPTDPAILPCIDLGTGRILLGLDFLERLWVYSSAYLQIILLVQKHGMSGVDIEIPQPARSMFEETFAAEQIGARLTWHHSWPRPHPSEVSPSTDGFAATELFLMTVAYVLLHEIGHAASGHKANDPPERWKAQEFEADDWATAWMLDHWREYANKPDENVFVKRAMGAVCYLAHVAGLEGHSRERGRGTHPDPVERLLRFLDRRVPSAKGAKAVRAELPWWVAMILVQLHLQAAGKPIPQAAKFHDAREFLQAVRFQLG